MMEYVRHVRRGKGGTLWGNDCGTQVVEVLGTLRESKCTTLLQGWVILSTFEEVTWHTRP